MTTSITHFFSKLIFTLLLGTLTFLVPSHSILAQSSKIKLGEAVPLRLQEGYLEIIGTSQRGYFVLKSRMHGAQISNFSNAALKIDIYSKNLKLRKSTPIPGIELDINAPCKKNYEFSDQEPNGDIFIYHSEYNKQTKQNTLYRSKLNTSSGKLGRGKRVISFRITRPNSDLRGGFQVFKSPDQSKKAIVALGIGPDRFSMLAHIGLFNSLNELSWQSKVYLPRTIERKVLKFGNLNNIGIGYPQAADHSILVTNDNKVHMLFKARITNRDKYNYHLITVSKEQKFGDRKIIKYPTTEHAITAAKLNISKNGDIICHALFGNQIGQIIQGVATFIFDSNDHRKISQKINEFSSNEKLKAFVSSVGPSVKADDRAENRLLKGREQLLLNQNLLQVIEHDNGSYTMIAEMFFRDNRRWFPQNYNQSSIKLDEFKIPQFIYEFGDIVCYNIDREGNLKWIKNIDRFQHGTNIATLSTKVSKIDDVINLLYVSQFKKNTFKPVFQLATISSSGNIKNTEIARGERKGKFGRFNIAPNTFIKSSEDEFIGIAYDNNKTSRLVKVVPY